MAINRGDLLLDGEDDTPDRFAYRAAHRAVASYNLSREVGKDGIWKEKDGSERRDPTSV